MNQRSSRSRLRGPMSVPLRISAALILIVLGSLLSGDIVLDSASITDLSPSNGETDAVNTPVYFISHHVTVFHREEPLPTREAVNVIAKNGYEPAHLVTQKSESHTWYGGDMSSWTSTLDPNGTHSFSQLGQYTAFFKTNQGSGSSEVNLKYVSTYFEIFNI